MTRILVAEDNPQARSALRYNLEDFGYAIVEATDGQEAIEKLQKDPQIALVLTDYDMPRMNGSDLTWAVRRFNDQIPVIMMSAHVSPHLLVEESGVDAFFSKGRFRMPEVHAEIQRLISTSRCSLKNFVELRDGRRVFAQVCPKKVGPG